MSLSVQIFLQRNGFSVTNGLNHDSIDGPGCLQFIRPSVEWFFFGDGVMMDFLSYLKYELIKKVVHQSDSIDSFQV